MKIVKPFIARLRKKKIYNSSRMNEQISLFPLTPSHLHVTSDYLTGDTWYVIVPLII